MMSPEFDWHRIFGTESRGADNVKPGIVRRFVVENQEICIYREGDQLFAFEPKCPHHGASLRNGKVIEHIVECPLHRYRFCMKTGENTSGEGYHLATFPVEIREEGLYVGFPK